MCRKKLETQYIVFIFKSIFPHLNTAATEAMCNIQSSEAIDHSVRSNPTRTTDFNLFVIITSIIACSGHTLFLFDFNLATWTYQNAFSWGIVFEAVVDEGNVCNLVSNLEEIDLITWRVWKGDIIYKISLVFWTVD